MQDISKRKGNHDSDSDLEIQSEQFNRVYSKLIKKMQNQKNQINSQENSSFCKDQNFNNKKLRENDNQKNSIGILQEENIQLIEQLDVSKQCQDDSEDKRRLRKRKNTNKSQQKSKQRSDEEQRSRSRSKNRDKDNKGKNHQKRKQKWHVYPHCQQINFTTDRFPKNILHLPIFNKKDQIINKILQNQFVLVTGETGCGKSTQVPRILYEYLRKINSNEKILCVQPRRLAVLNLHHILESQMYQKGLIGYQIAMQTHISQNTRILFMTNGIFLQRLVHSTDIFQNYPFIILDEVHERDIDTDFILLAIKRIIKNHPRLRIILMSATIDNQLFRYYFARDHIEKFMKQQNFYRKIIKMTTLSQNMEENSGEQSQNQQKLYDKLGYEFMQSKNPCPAINITQTGKYNRQTYYLDTIGDFLRRPYCLRWGTVIFSEKYPNTHRQLFQIINVIIQEIISRSPKDCSYSSILIFLPGLLEIQNLADSITRYFGRQKSANLLDVISVHSSILNQQLTKKLHTLSYDKIKIILSTNIAESSITVMGVKYVIDFCLSKEVRFDQKSRMENLQLIWASKASCKQRAGRTGRVCDGIIIRLVQQQFYEKLPQYSTPEIQRSSLDRLILRIKMIHQNESNQIFSDPGEVLGTAIQPPNLKHIDQAIKSLLFCGGLKMIDDDLQLTNLGRLYIDLPIDITYSKMLIMSILFGTFDDILILVSLLSQNKNAFKRANIQKNYLEYFKLIDNTHRCDFMALIKAFKAKKQGKGNLLVNFDIYYETKILIEDLGRRIQKKGLLQNYQSAQKYEDYADRFKFTLIGGFLNKMIMVRQPIYDDKQQKRVKRMRHDNISVNKTLTLLNSQVIKKNSSDNSLGDQKLVNMWKGHITRILGIDQKAVSITLTLGIAFIHFKEERHLNRLMFTKYMQDNRRLTDDKTFQQSQGNAVVITVPMMLRCLGDIDYMQSGTMFTLAKDQRITIDNFSQNRLVSVDQGQRKRFMITNTVMQQSSRLFCRYSSLLPDIPNLQVLAHLVFYPFVTLIIDKKGKRYQYLFLKKKSKLKIQYQLSNQQIQEVNQLRKIIKDFFSLKNKQLQEQQQNRQMRQSNQNIFQNYSNFWPRLRVYMNRSRLTTVDQNRWQQHFFKQCNIDTASFQDNNHIVNQNKEQNIQSQKEFMNPIPIRTLKQSYFSSQTISQTVYKERMELYNQWKIQKLSDLRLLREKAINRNAYLCCQICELHIAPLKSVGSIQNLYYRELYNYVSDNIKQLPFNQIGGDYFCSMLMGLFIQKQYKVYGCKNQHYFAIQFQNQRNLKITKFSQLKIKYPDGSIEKTDFDKLQPSRWIKNNQLALKRKQNMKIQTHCFICDQNFLFYKDLENHLKDSYHQENVKDFKIGMNLNIHFKQEDVDGY